jgi:hypothetical protein
MLHPRIDERRFGFVQATFGIKYVEILPLAFTEPHRRHPRGLAARANLSVARRKTGPDRAISDQRILDIAKRAKHGPVVIDQRGIGAGVGDANLSPQARHIEHTPIEARAARESKRTTAEQGFEAAGEQSDEAGQAHRRKQVGFGDAAPRGGRRERAFGGGDIGSPPEQIGRSTDTDLRDLRQTGCRRSRTGKSLRCLAEQYGERMTRGADALLDPGQRRFDSGKPGLGANDVETCAGAMSSERR